ncbi:hypothetical protein ACVQ92_08515 [Staphylococcus aureus]
MTEFMEEVLIDDNMVFDIDNLKGFLNDTSSFGFIAKENNKIIGFAYCYTLLRPDGKTMFYLHSIECYCTLSRQRLWFKIIIFY